ncbi:MAG: class I SAM-dependent RNA methyltransferase [Paracoccaceae bacterium]
METPFEIFLIAPPGLESVLAEEAREAGFAGAKAVPGGVAFEGDWPDVWRANLTLRGATRVLVRVGSFMAFHLAQLDKRSRKVAWASLLNRDIPVKVDATSHKSKIYHAGAAQERIETALKADGFTIGDGQSLKVRIDDNRVTLSLDTSGESLHKRGHKEAVGKAPMRETLAALFLRQAGYSGQEPVLDPMCGSGTFPIEAAEIARGLLPGRSRRFAFEDLPSFHAAQWKRMKGDGGLRDTDLRFHGSDRDQGAVQMAQANAARAGVDDLMQFACHSFSGVTRPDGAPGLVIINPPYGGRIGQKHMLYGLHTALGEVLRERFKGWRVGIITSEPGLAKVTGLRFLPDGPLVPHGGLKVRLYQTPPLK